MFGDRLSVMKRCAIGGIGFVVAALLVPVIGIVAVSGFSDFPDSALHAGTILFFVLLGVVASTGLAVALRNPVRRVLIMVRGGLGFGVAGVLTVANAEGGGIAFIPLAGAIVGLALARERRSESQSERSWAEAPSLSSPSCRQSWRTIRL